jgi:hypothetical protein
LTSRRALSYSSILGENLRKQASASLLAETICKAIPSFGFVPNTCMPFRDVPQYFLQFLDNLESRIFGLIEQANELDQALADFGTKLRTVSTIAESEMKVVAEGERVLKNGLWTRLGGNKGDLAAFQRNIGSLQRVLDYHSIAKRCLTTTKESLQGMLNSLKELRPLTNKANTRSSGFALETILMQITLGMERIKDRLEKRGVEGSSLRTLNAGN